MKPSHLSSCWPLLLPFVVTACGGSFPPPNERLSSAEGATRSAHELAAESDPQAALHLKLANEQIEKAKAAMKNDDNKAADLWLQRASADAELAVQLAKGAKAKAEAQAAQDRASALRGGK